MIIDFEILNLQKGKKKYYSMLKNSLSKIGKPLILI